MGGGVGLMLWHFAKGLPKSEAGPVNKEEVFFEGHFKMGIAVPFLFLRPGTQMVIYEDVS